MEVPQFALESQAAAIDVLWEAGLKTDADVAGYLTWLREPVIGTKVNCGQPDHVSPFRFVSDILTRRVLDFLVWANRSGSKSYLAALIVWSLSSFVRRMETTVLGGSGEQSSRVYRAMNSFWSLTNLGNDYLASEPTRRLTEWKNGSRVAVLLASQRSVRGPHPNFLLMDEIDEMAPDIYTAALSQPQSKFGIPAAIGKLSTNHKAAGVMDVAIASAARTKTPVYKWCIWECLESCRDFHCSTCPLTAICPGEQMKQADGYYKMADFIEKLSELSQAVLTLEWLCLKVGRTDLIYGAEFDEAVHCGPGVPGFARDLPALISLDWGGVHPFSLGVWQYFAELPAWVRVDEIYQAGITNTRLIDIARKQAWWVNIRGGVADPSRADLIGEWAEAGVKLDPADNAVDAGIDTVRNALKPVIGNPLFYANAKCKGWRTEIQTYIERNGRPVKANDHAMDETRYFARWKLLTKRARRGRAYAPGMVTSKPKELSKAIPAPQPGPQPAVLTTLRLKPQTPPPLPPITPGGEHDQESLYRSSVRKGRVFISGSGKSRKDRDTQETRESVLPEDDEGSVSF